MMVKARTLQESMTSIMGLRIGDDMRAPGVFGRAGFLHLGIVQWFGESPYPRGCGNAIVGWKGDGQ